MTFFSLLFCRP